jgi:glucan phosphoethanolaminetransferase (alkaline phosphatase superfamily)
MYVSDHGESPSSPLWRDVKSRDTFEIPLLIWLSPEYERRYPGTASSVSTAKRRQLRLNQLIEGMLELAQVKGYSDRHSTGNFLAPQFYGIDALREENK